MQSEDEASLDNDYYCFLNVPRTASDAQITAAYKKLARLYHPDKHQVGNLRREATSIDYIVRLPDS